MMQCVGFQCLHAIHMYARSQSGPASENFAHPPALQHVSEIRGHVALTEKIDAAERLWRISGEATMRSLQPDVVTEKIDVAERLRRISGEATM